MTAGAMSASRAEQIGDALGDVEAVLLEPGCFGDCSVGDAAVSLASEFVGAYRDDEIVRRLEELVEAERVGNLRVAGRHLQAVRRKLKIRWGIVPLVSEPVIPDAEAKRLAAAAERRVQNAAKVQVTAPRSRPVSPLTPRTGERPVTAPRAA